MRRPTSWRLWATVFSSLLAVSWHAVVHAVVTIDVPRETGAPGETVTLSVTLRSADAPASLQNDLMLPAGLSFTACRDNPALQKDATAFGFYAPGGPCDPPQEECRHVRALG